jgi:D-3-phosphoglycerate dehydrogenase / 2-oxoglutarate reductase
VRPVSAKQVLVLDRLFDDLAIEQAAASSRGWSVKRWDGEEATLAAAEVAVHVRTRVDRSLLERMPMCRVIGRFGTGLDTVDLDAARELGITVVNVRDYCVPEMASHSLVLAFALERRIEAGWDNAAMQELDWQGFAAIRPIAGRATATVVGIGSIGSAVAGAFVALGYDVLAVTERGLERARRIGAKVVSLDDGVGAGDFVLLHAALEPGTVKLIDASRLALMKPSAILINTARLGLMDQPAVARALDLSGLGGLGLDARLEADSPLRRLLGDPRVLVTPHVGWYSERSAAKLRSETLLRSIEAFERLAGAAPEAGTLEGAL